MRCAKCGAENSAGKRFCGDCGAAVVNRCARCGAENPPEKKFCGDCGNALGMEVVAERGKPSAAGADGGVRIAPERQTPETIEGERKTVTALFADIKGSTELMEDLDPEAARAIIDPALKLMIDAAHRYDGYVVQSTGDGIFALFGAPVAHEDHPQRALYAALRVQEEMSRYSAKVIADGGMPIEARVGVNTGEVVVRSITTGAGQTEYTPIGHTTNLASRMQAVAPTGSIAISEQTRKFVEGYFQLKARGPTRVKGLSEPMNVYEVTGIGPLRTRLQRAVGRGLTKFVGREREMEALKHAAEHAKSAHGQIVAAMAEPGVGKSRLYFEFKATSQSGWMVLETFSVSHGKASAYLPVIDLLRNYFRIAGEDDERTRREKVAGKITILDRSLEDTLPYLFSLLGIAAGDDPLAQMDGQIKKRRTLEAIKRIALRESLNQPLMVIFEDLHWIDEQTQELLNLLADSIGTAKILLLVNYRPEYSHQWNSKTYYTQLRLDPLGKESADQMLSSLLGASPAPATQSSGASRERPASDLQVAGRVRAQDSLEGLKRLIIERTEGNPFFMEEMVQVLLDEGALIRNGTVHLTKPLAELKTPATVQAILASRIDRLPPDEKELLQTLAVIGREFALSLVKHIVEGRKNDELERMLAELQIAEFIYEQPASGDIEYIFKHALTQEAAYNSVLIERRKLLHERAGAALESMFADQLDDHLDELARHYSRTDNVEKALEYIVLGGEQAVRRSAYSEAISRFRSGLELLEILPNDAPRWRHELALQIALGPMLIATEGFADGNAEIAYTRALKLCNEIGDGMQLFRIQRGLWVFHLVRGEYGSARNLAEQLLGLAERRHDHALFVEAHYAIGLTVFYLGELQEARFHLERSISLYDPPQHRSHTVLFGYDPKVACLSDLAWALWILGYPDSGLEKAREALFVARELEHPYNVAMAMIWLSWVLQCRRQGQASQELADAAVELSTEQGFPSWVAMATVMSGAALVEREETQRGVELLRRGLAAYRLTRTEAGRIFGLTVLAGAHGKLSSPEKALTLVAEGFAIAEQTGERYYEAELHRTKGEALLQFRIQAREGEADACFRRAIEVARKQSAKSLELRATMSLARLLAKQGKRDEARAMLGEIYGWFTEGFDTADLIDAKALLDEPN